MRLLAPTRRTPNAKGGVVSPSSNKELEELRRHIAEYSAEANKQTLKLNKLRIDYENSKEKYNQSLEKLSDEYFKKEQELSSKVSSLEEKARQIEESIEAKDYKKKVKELEQALKDVENDRKSLREVTNSVALSQNASMNLLKELEEREDQLNEAYEMLSLAKNDLEIRSRSEQAREIAIQQSIDAQIEHLNSREKALIAKNGDLDALIRSVKLKEDQIAKKNADIAKKEKYLADRKAKLDSLIDYYERKKRQ